jgi:hypothetical protein
MLLAVTPATAGSAGSAASAPKTSGPVTIAAGLANPRQIAVDQHGRLLVAEAGTGAFQAAHPGGCFTAEEGTSCVGDTGVVTRITNPGKRTKAGDSPIASQILSVGGKGSGASDPAGAGATGIDAVSVAPNGNVFGIVTYIPKGLKPEPRNVRRENGRLVQIVNGTLKPIANIGRYSLNHPNKGHAKDSDPYGVLALNNKVYVTDAANNTLLVVRNGHIKTLHVFPYRHGAPGPNGLGKHGSFDTVPTSLAMDSKGHLYVGTLGSLIPGKGKVYEMTKSGHVIRVIKKLSQVAAVAVDPKGSVYAAEIFGGQQAPFGSAGPNGKLVKIWTSGKRRSMSVPLPGGVAVTGGHIYVSELSINPTQGSVVRIS